MPACQAKRKATVGNRANVEDRCWGRGGEDAGGRVGGIRKQGRSGKASVGLSDRERANIFSASGAQPVITASIVCKWKLKNASHTP